MKLIIIPCNFTGEHWNLIVLVNWLSLFLNEATEKFKLLSIDSFHREKCVLGEEHKVVLGTCLLDLYQQLCPRKQRAQEKVTKFDVNKWCGDEQVDIVRQCFHQTNTTDCAVLLIAHV